MKRWLRFLGDCILSCVFIILGSYIGSSISLYVHKDDVTVILMQPINECVEGK